MTTNNPPTRSEFKRGVKDCLPVIIGMLPFALILGVQGGQKGMSPLEMSMMAGLNFAGGSEFAAVGLWGSPLPALLIITVTLMINSRHILMGAALAPYLKGLPLKKALPALFFMADESWAMSLADIHRRKKLGLGLPLFSLPYYMGVSLTLYAVWVVFTGLGAAVGPGLGNVEAWGFGMAFPAVFLVLLRGLWKGFAAARPWLVSLVAAAAVYLAADGAWYVPAGAAAGLLAAYFGGDKA
ncbi:AzlC family ABC transporter permease [Neisseria musculi]|uniref:AzlC family ABC transporter permease n=1 Tax=Neisseria musculi TaxID=1815583 RepID=UPI00164AE2A7|nr:AzlC family ABC transporter permease [Neisseria musculi]QNT59626.1 azlC family protein [Neisseria musculi]